MATFFPPCAADETLYSICSRIHFLSGNKDAATTSRRLLGHATGMLWPDVFLGLDSLSRCSSGILSSGAATVRQRAPVAAYLPFLDSGRRHAVLSQILGGSVRANRRHAGWVWGRLPSRNELRLCEVCAANQRKRLGFAYWRSRHQYPGVWVCHEHLIPLRYIPTGCGRFRGWQDANRACPERISSIPDGLVASLAKVGDVVDWIANQETVNASALIVMFRDRARKCGRAALRTRLSANELRGIADEIGGRASAAGVPHYEWFASPHWADLALHERRTPHPLPWALLLATCGGVSRSELSRDYFEALTRLPHPDLFRTHAAHQSGRAPEALYEAFDKPSTVAEVCVSLKLRKSEIQGWLTRDRALAKHKRTQEKSVKSEAAALILQSYVGKDKIGRSALLIKERWAVDTLAQTDVSLLEKLLPKPRSIQMSLAY